MAVADPGDATGRLLPVRCEKRVTHRRAETLVPEESLNGAQIDAQLQQVRGGRMTEGADRDRLGKPGQAGGMHTNVAGAPGR